MPKKKGDEARSQKDLIYELEQLRKEVSELKTEKTELQQKGELFRIERDNLKNIFQAMDDGVYIVNKKFDIQYVNPVLTKEFGIYEGRKCYEYFHSRKEFCPWCKNQEVFNGKTVHWEWYSPKTDKTYELIDTPIKNPDGSIFKLEIFRDITERKHIEEELRKYQENLEKLIEERTLSLKKEIAEHKRSEDELRKSQLKLLDSQYIAGMGDFTWDLITDIVTWSDGMYKLLKYDKKEAIDFAKVNVDIHYPDDLKRVTKWLMDSIASGKELLEPNEYRLICKDGEVIHVQTNGQIEYQKGKPITLFGTCLNITLRKQSEEEKIKLEGQLQQAQKMEAIGTLAGGIAHDFNNILGVIMGYTELTLDDLSDTKMAEKNLHRVMKASDRAKDMVDQILAFSRKRDQTMRSVNIEKVIKEVIIFLRSSIPTTIKIRSNIEKDLGLIFGNATQVNQILMNLCTNAAYAMKEEGGLLEIGLKEVILDKASSVIFDLDPGRYQHLYVRDTGTGIRKEIIERIFEPYFTTKNVIEGTGMGLAVIYGIVKSHKGAIKVYSEPGKGTIFNVYFPVLELEKTLALHKDQHPVLLGNNEKVLLIDDEIPLVELYSKMLKRLGYQVESKSSSIEALEAFRANPDKFDIIVTDMTMPDMTGVKLAFEIHKIKPDIPVILCTGFSNGINKNNYYAKGISALIMKPVEKKELSVTIRRVLEQKHKF